VIEIPLYEASALLRRREPREEAVRRVDFCRFPRVCADGRRRRGLTHDVSPNGLRIRVEQPEPVGALIRLRLWGEDGKPGRERLGRVAWSRAVGGGEHHLGVALLPDTGQRPIRLRYRRRPGSGAA